MSTNVLLPIATYPDPTSKVGLGNALSLSLRLGAKVTAVAQEVDIAPISSTLGEALLGLSRMSAEAEAHSRQRAVETDRWIRDRAQGLGIEVDVSTVRCRPEAFGEGLLPYARSHDLTIVVQDGGDPQRQADNETLIFGSGGPVILVPLAAAVPVAERRAVPLNIVVAWDGGRAASRALRDALPILPLADLVSIVTIGDDKNIHPLSIGGIQALLDHHGIRNRHLHRERGSSPIGDALQAVAVAEEADLLVMGAYGRTRLQEFILGGATRTVTHAPRLPILLSH
ncbi:hypothetical protein ASD04_11095 [Devosia sp. Root436]|uniref:universal stress protein n=1 Tax=Devosia sp. Root436 TaxID=1736537 RepID=UPI0006F325D0|nr:universal stress protein [Devosia sp. Root436]KQX38163.1 hypothetical protein ASD04_11095 [Devosia sp. Root436]